RVPARPVQCQQEEKFVRTGFQSPILPPAKFAASARISIFGLRSAQGLLTLIRIACFPERCLPRLVAVSFAAAPATADGTGWQHLPVFFRRLLFHERAVPAALVPWPPRRTPAPPPPIDHRPFEPLALAAHLRPPGRALAAREPAGDGSEL